MFRKWPIYAGYFVLFGSSIINSIGSQNAQLFRESQPIRLLETPKSLSECILINSAPGNWGGYFLQEKINLGCNVAVANQEHQRLKL